MIYSRYLGWGGPHISVPTHDIQVFGMERSGHHGVINWILGHYDAHVHYNNCDNWFTPYFIVRRNNIFTCGTPPHKRLASIEDNPMWIPDWQKENLLVKLKSLLPVPAIRVLVVRCPYNLYASRFEALKRTDGDFNEEQRERYLDPTVWKYCAEEFCGTTDHLKFDVKICFDKWFSDPVYRAGLSTWFGEFTDRGLQKVESFGCGSSFDGAKYDGAAQDMDVLKRYLNYINDEKYIEKIIKDEEVKTLAIKIFGEEDCLHKISSITT